MTTETTTTETTEAAPPASPETIALNAQIDGEPGANKEEAEADPPKKERTPEERERIRLERKVSRLLQQRAELRAQVLQGSRGLTREQAGNETSEQQSANETLQLSRQELQELIDKEARKLAPSIKQQEAEIEHRRAVVTRLAKDWGPEKFDAYASDLDDAFGGLADDKGQPKPAADAIFESEDPRALIEYLADPDHADEAEALGRMSAVQAGRAIAKLEAKIASDKSKAKPQPSKAADPIEPIKGQGNAPKSLQDLPYDDFVRRRKQQIASRR